jgi:hypothetical protein
MADLAKAGNVPHGVNNVVRGLAFRFVNDQRPIERDCLRLSHDSGA